MPGGEEEGKPPFDPAAVGDYTRSRLVSRTDEDSASVPFRVAVCSAAPFSVLHCTHLHEHPVGPADSTHTHGPDKPKAFRRGGWVARSAFPARSLDFPDVAY